MCCDDADGTWIELSAAARNVRAYLLLRRKTGPEAAVHETSEPDSAAGGTAERESDAIRSSK